MADPLTDPDPARQPHEGADAAPPAPVAPLVELGRAIAGAAPVRTEIAHGELIVHAQPEGLIALMRGLRDDPRFAFEQLMELCGVDWPDRTPRFEVAYMLLSVSRNQRVRVLVPTTDQQPVPSVHTIWPVATWFEREAWDLFGIRFAGQPDLRRILTDYGFEGHPLRKDFPLTGRVEVRYDEERKAVIYEPVNLTQDLRTFDYESPWEAMTTLPGDEKAHVGRQELTQTERALVGKGDA